MELRPRAARWFEVVVPQEHAHDTMEALARHSEVQFEWTGERKVAAGLAVLHGCVSRYRDLEADLSRCWPRPVFEKRCCSLSVEASADASVRDIERWRADSAPLRQRLDRLRRQRIDLDLWDPILYAMAGGGLDMQAFARAGPALCGLCLVTESDSDVELPASALALRRDVNDQVVLLVLTAPNPAADLCAKVRRTGCVCLDLPRWFESDARACRVALPRQRASLDRSITGVERELIALAQRQGVGRAAGLLERVDWFLRNAEHIRCDGEYCWITGWTSETESGRMNLALQRAGVDASVALMEPPVDAVTPSVIRNPIWLEAFEVFTRAVGVPGVREADPTTWVALLVPLLFGYMCGDVGHGAVILLTGLFVRARTRLWPLLVFAGFASMGFGFAYGDVFGMEHLIDPLWLRPMDQPFTVLLVPVLVGSLVLTLGILLHVVETCWRGQGGAEGVVDAAQLMVYWGLLLVFVDVRLGWLAPIGASLCLFNRWRVERSPLALLTGVGHLVESSFTLLLNTLSFARVGAFALAHAALASAVLAIADSADGAAAVAAILVVGNLAVIVIEGLVVSIQTTRLVLFEFFMRFFEGRGRAFRPAAKPPGNGDRY